MQIILVSSDARKDHFLFDFLGEYGQVTIKNSLSELEENEKPDLVVTDVSVIDAEQRDLIAALGNKDPGIRWIFIADAIGPLDLPGLQMAFVSRALSQNLIIEEVRNLIYPTSKAWLGMLNFSWKRIPYTVPIRDIVFIEHISRITVIHTVRGDFKSSWLIRDFLEILPDCCACIHASYIVNMNYIRSVSYSQVDLQDGRVLPLSRSKSDDFHQIYQAYMSR